MASGSSSSSKSPMLPTSAEQDPKENSVIHVSVCRLLNGNRYICEVCNKGFPRIQNLTLHRRVHKLPFSLKKNTANKHPGTRNVYLCPEPTCLHHDSSHALGDFGGLKKHYLRKHCTEKNYRCDTCSKAYAAEADLKAHSKVCGKRKQICQRSRFARGNSFVAHQGCSATKEHEAVAGRSSTLRIGDSSRKITTKNNNSHLIGSSTPYAPTFNMGDNSMGSTSSDNPCSLIGLYATHPDPHITAFQNLYNSYPFATPDQSQFYPSGIDNGSLMTDPSIGSNLGQIFPDFFSPSSSQQNQHKLQADFDSRFHTDLLMGKIPLDNGNLMGGDMNIYGNGEGSSSNPFNGFIVDPSSSNPFNGVIVDPSSSNPFNGLIVDPSSSHNLIPAVHNTSLNGMPNTVCGVGSSTFNQEFDGSYDQGSNYEYGDCSGQSDYGYEMEVPNFEESAATAGEVAPYGQVLDQLRGFWF